METIWLVLTAASMGYALVTGRAGEAAEALLGAGRDAVMMLVTLAGAMTLWGGLLEVMRESGDVARLGRALRRGLARLFPPLPDGCWEPMSVNLAANLLGLGNAATPAGIQAARRLEEEGGAGKRALAMLLALNNSSLQLMPTTVMTLRAAHGAANPADVWGATLLSSGAATVAAAALMALALRFGRGWDA